MTQSLSNLMNSPLALAALILWLLLAFLAVRACRKWANERNAEKLFIKTIRPFRLKNINFPILAPAGVR